MPSYSGQCHCGQVQFSFTTDEPLSKALRCNCSICQRLGALHTPRLDPSQLQLVSGHEQRHIYSHGDKDIAFNFCSHCHVYVFMQPAKATPEGFCRANLNCCDEIDQASLETVFFDGRNLL